MAGKTVATGAGDDREGNEQMSVNCSRIFSTEILAPFSSALAAAIR